MQNNAYSAGLVLAWLVTPESLILVNKSSGLSGLDAVFGLGIGVLLAMTGVVALHHPQLVRAGYTSDVEVLSANMRKSFALALILGGRIPLILFVATGMLVSSGLAFNEVFLYWFPDFLFAVALLAGILALHAFAGQAVLKVQLAAVCVVLIGLLILAILGIIGEPESNSGYRGLQGRLTIPVTALACIPFFGFDFIRAKGNYAVVLLALLCGFTILLMWAVTATKLIAPATLAESAVTYMFVAKAAAGEAGRYLMGAVIIGGVIAGVNGLFYVVAEASAKLAQEKLVPQVFAGGKLAVVVIGIIVGAMMMGGAAGTHVLETQIRGAVILWLVYLASRCISAGLLLSGVSGHGKIMGYLSGFTFFLIGGVLLFTSPQATYLIGYTATAFCGAYLLALAVVLVHEQRYSST